MLCGGYRKHLVRVVAVLSLAAIPLACVAPEPTVQNPFLGTWATTATAQHSIRPLAAACFASATTRKAARR